MNLNNPVETAAREHSAAKSQFAERGFVTRSTLGAPEVGARSGLSSMVGRYEGFASDQER